MSEKALCETIRKFGVIEHHQLMKLRSAHSQIVQAQSRVPRRMRAVGGGAEHEMRAGMYVRRTRRKFFQRVDRALPIVPAREEF